MMIFNVGSKNPTKIRAVRETIKQYLFLNPFRLNSMDVSSGVSEQPIGIEEIVKGAKNRARNSFVNCNYSFGLESGLERVPGTRTGHMDVCICAIYDGENYHLGKSCAFEPPVEVVNLAVNHGMDLNQAIYQTKLSKRKNIGSAEGIIGLLTNGNVTRKDYTMQAIHMAMIQIRNPELYK